MTATADHAAPATALPGPAALPPMDVASRLRRLTAGLGAAGCDGLVVSSLTNVRYLTGMVAPVTENVPDPASAPNEQERKGHDLGVFPLCRGRSEVKST